MAVDGRHFRRLSSAPSRQFTQFWTRHSRRWIPLHGVICMLRVTSVGLRHFGDSPQGNSEEDLWGPFKICCCWIRVLFLPHVAPRADGGVPCFSCPVASCPTTRSTAAIRSRHSRIG